MRNLNNDSVFQLLCVPPGETMECRTDSDERLRGLEDHPHQEDSDYDKPRKGKAGLNGLLNDLGEISLQLITLVTMCFQPLVDFSAYCIITITHSFPLETLETLVMSQR